VDISESVNFSSNQPIYAFKDSLHEEGIELWLE
jgi:hypothetical protein